MHTTDVILKIGGSVIALFGGASALVIAVCGFGAKFMADREIEKHKSDLNAGVEAQKAELNKQIESYKADLTRSLEVVKGQLSREADKYRLQLRKSELLFDKEVSAASAFSVLHDSTRPAFSHPDMDWEEACNEVASRFDVTEQAIQKYLTTYAAVLNEEIRVDLRACLALASQHKFDAYETPDHPVSREARSAAEELLDKLKEVESLLFALIRSDTES